MTPKIPKKTTIVPPPMPPVGKSDTTGRIQKPVVEKSLDKPILSFRRQTPREEPFEPDIGIKAPKTDGFSRRDSAKIMVDG